MQERDGQRALEAIRRFGRDAVAFQALESAMRHWFDAPPPEGTGACIAYADTGGAWVAAGGPLAPAREVRRAAERFVEAARRAGRRASFFATERAIDGFAALTIGEQPVLSPAQWLDRARHHRRFREQLRRARAKGVRVRRVAPDELRPGTSLRAEVEALAARWLRGRPMEPMGFLVALEPFHAPDEHRYLIAVRDERVVAFASAVPIPARRGWLLEDAVRAPDAPNGTSEALLDALCREVADAPMLTLGLAPLSGPGPSWRRVAARVGRPLYDFAGLRAYKERIHPDAWEPVRHVFPRADGRVRPMLDALRAFAGGSLVRFGLRSLARHPAGAPWALALVLVAWTALLAVLTLADHAGIFGYDRATLAGWVAFDAVLAFLLFRFAHRPRAGALLLATLLACSDAVLSLLHLHRTGWPHASWHLALRLVATVGPAVGALALAWATLVRLRLRERVGW